MAYIMEFILNLLFIRGKFLTATAAETFHEAFKKCMHFKRKFAMEYNSGQVNIPFENMMEFINYNSRKYRCEGDTYVVTSEVQYNLFSKNQEKQHLRQLICKNVTGEDETNMSETPAKQIKETPKKSNLKTDPEMEHHEGNQPKNKKKTLNEDHILDNLRAMLKSQEFLFKNLIQLVEVLEKNEILETNNNKLVKVKKKLSACKDILSSTSHSHKLSTVINNIIEEEITRCRFRPGENKTSEEISLKVPKPEGLAAALETHKNQVRPVKKMHENKMQKVSTMLAEKEKVLKPEKRNTVSRKNEINIKETMSKFEKKNDVARNNDICIKVNTLKSEKRNKVSTKNEIRAKIEIKPETLLRRVQSATDLRKIYINNKKTLMPTKNYEQVLKENANVGKMILINEEHFKSFENTLWHSLTTMRYLSLKDDYLNMCRCAYYNKKQFMATEAVISKRMKHDAEVKNFQEVTKVNNSMFQIVESKLLFETVKQELNNIGQLPLTDHFLKNDTFLKMKKEITNNESEKEFANKLPSKTQSTQDNVRQKDEEDKSKSTDTKPFTDNSTKQKSDKSAAVKETKSYIPKPKIQETESKIENQNYDPQKFKTNLHEFHPAVINKKELQEFMPNFDEGISIEVVENEKIHLNLAESQKKLDSPCSNQETNTIINNDVIKTSGGNTEQNIQNRPNKFQNLSESKEQHKPKKSEQLDNSSEKAPEQKKNESITNVHNLGKHEQISPVFTNNYKLNRSQIAADKKSSNSWKTAPSTPKKDFQEKLQSFQSNKKGNNPRIYVSLVRSEDIKKISWEQQPNQNPLSLIDKSKEPDLYARKYEKEDEKISSKIEEKKFQDVSTQKKKAGKSKIIKNIKASTSIARDISHANQTPSPIPKAQNTSLSETRNLNNENLFLNKNKGNAERNKKEIFTYTNIELKEKLVTNYQPEEDKKEKEIFKGDKKEIFTNMNIKLEENTSTHFKPATEKNETKKDEIRGILKKAPTTSLKKQNIESSKLQKVANKTANNNSLATSSNHQELKNEADVLKINEKAFKELETTMRSVHLIVDKSPNKPAKTMKTTTEIKKRKIDEPMKKNLSTRRHFTVTQKSFIFKDIEITPVGDRLSLYKEVKKQTGKYFMLKAKTFLKKNFQKNKNSTPEKTDIRNTHSLAQSSKTEEEKRKSYSPMRRTTKNAMKRQQVQTILPKAFMQKEEKKKAEVKLIENEAGKIEKKYNKLTKLIKRHISGTYRNTYLGVTKNVGSQTACDSFVQSLLEKEADEHVHYVMWEAIDDVNISNILKI